MTSTGPAASATAELVVSGMHCESCATLIEEVLAEQDGVGTASVDLFNARARVEYDPARLTVDDLTVTIAGAGYSAAPVG